MAVYQGARPRTIALPGRPRDRGRARRCRAVVPARPSARGAARAGSALVLGGIVVAFMLAFFSLAQEVRVSATSYDIGRLQIERSGSTRASRSSPRT